MRTSSLACAACLIVAGLLPGGTWWLNSIIFTGACIWAFLAGIEYHRR